MPRTYDNPSIKDDMTKPSLMFEDDGSLQEIRAYTDTKIYVHEYFNRTSFARKFSGYGYDGHSPASEVVANAAMRALL